MQIPGERDTNSQNERNTERCDQRHMSDARSPAGRLSRIKPIIRQRGRAVCQEKTERLCREIADTNVALVVGREAAVGSIGDEDQTEEGIEAGLCDQ